MATFRFLLLSIISLTLFVGCQSTTYYVQLPEDLEKHLLYGEKGQAFEPLSLEIAVGDAQSTPKRTSVTRSNFPKTGGGVYSIPVQQGLAANSFLSVRLGTGGFLNSDSDAIVFQERPPLSVRNYPLFRRVFVVGELPKDVPPPSEASFSGSTGAGEILGQCDSQRIDVTGQSVKIDLGYLPLGVSALSVRLKTTPERWATCSLDAAVSYWENEKERKTEYPIEWETR